MSKAELEVLASKLDDRFAKNGYAVTPEVVQMARQLDGIIAREIGNWTTEKGSLTGSNLAELLAPLSNPKDRLESMPSLRHPLPDKSSS